MTADRLADQPGASRERAEERASVVAGQAGQRGEMAVATILSMCDRLLAEAGRREHLFAWLRVPQSEGGGWLAVDAYYPRNRLVVVCAPERKPHQGLYAHEVPEHGLRLLMLAPAELGADPGNARRALERMLASVGPIPERVPRPPARGPKSPAPGIPSQPRTPPRRRPSRARAVVRASRPAAEPLRRVRAAARLTTTPRRPPPSAAHPGSPRPRPGLHGDAWRGLPRGNARVGAQRQTLGILHGLVLAGTLVIELYVDVGGVALGAGRVVLAFGIALDACSRLLGAIAAGRSGSRLWSWACLFGGSPAVAVFALWRPSGPVQEDPGPLAGLMALLACLLVALGLLLRV